MSGIAGIIRFDGAPIEPGLVEKMTAAMSHRGPDGIKHWVKGSVALGQCMLRTTPESLEEAQPLANEDESVVLTMDGRVDNWEELREELLGRGAHLRTRSDAELVLRAYETWSQDCLHHVDGDFALVIWDARRRTVFCARDRFGGKPLNYCWDGKALIFASELRAVLQLPQVGLGANEDMLAEYLTGQFCSNTETLWRDVWRLAPGHAMAVTKAGATPHAYWHPDVVTMVGLRDDEEYFRRYLELLADSVSRLSRTTARAACEVSGGLDSSAVFCMMHHLRETGRLRAGELDGFTLAFDQGGPANEVAYARAVAAHLNVAIQEIPPDIEPLSWYEERARATRAFPGYPNGVMSHGVLRRARQSGARVLLNGIGGDEWLGGSRVYYAEHLAARDWMCLLDSAGDDVRAHGVARTLSWIGRQGVFRLLPAVLQSGARRLARRSAAGPAAASRAYWLSPEMRERIHARMASCPSAADQETGRIGHQAMLGYLRDAHHHHATEMTEQFGAEHGIEIRRPFYTQALVQFAFSTPERMRLRGSQNKFMHVNALRGVMPKAVLERQDKAEFSVVFDEHLKHMKPYFAQHVARSRPEWLAADGIERLFEEYETNRSQKWPIWALWGVFGCDKLIPGADWQGCRQPAA